METESAIDVFLLYPLVMTNVAIEHGHKHSGFSHEKILIFHSYVKLPKGTMWPLLKYIWGDLINEMFFSDAFSYGMSLWETHTVGYRLGGQNRPSVHTKKPGFVHILSIYLSIYIYIYVYIYMYTYIYIHIYIHTPSYFGKRFQPPLPPSRQSPIQTVPARTGESKIVLSGHESLVARPMLDLHYDHWICPEMADTNMVESWCYFD